MIMRKMLLFVPVLLGVAVSVYALAADKNPVVVMDTSMGPIKIELLQDKAPTTVQNFLAYVDDKFYDGTIFHRIIPGFMIQGGGFEPGMHQKSTKTPIKNESANGVSNARGTVAMARTSDPDSATAQFFINVVDNQRLDRGPRTGAGYCVFGRVIDGMDVVDKIKDAPTGQKGPHANVPVQDVTIKSVRRAEQ
jgi:cyclophilin family peptidyl-prolyl cis-trans isomerase